MLIIKWRWSARQKINTVECRNNAVQYCKILHKYLQEVRQIINQMLNPQKNSPYLAPTGELWGVFCEYLWENWPRYYGAALYKAHKGTMILQSIRSTVRKVFKNRPIVVTALMSLCSLSVSAFVAVVLHDQQCVGISKCRSAVAVHSLDFRFAVNSYIAMVISMMAKKTRKWHLR